MKPIRKFGEIVTVVSMAGTYANFLYYFLEKFSKKTPSRPQENIYRPTGTAHEIDSSQYDVKISKSFDLQRMENYEGKEGLPICQIICDEDKEYLFLEKGIFFRVDDNGDSPDDMWQKDLNQVSHFFKNHVKHLKETFGIDGNKIPKHIVREWYKKQFVDPTHAMPFQKECGEWRNNPFFVKQDTFKFKTSSFFNYDNFISTIRLLDKRFDIELDFEKEKDMKDLFETGYKLDETRQQINNTFETIKTIDSKKEIEIMPLDVSQEAYICAHVQKKYDINLKLGENFYKNTKEILPLLPNEPKLPTGSFDYF